MLFDTHAHLTDKKFNPDREEILHSLPAQGVGLVLNPGCDLPDSRAALALAQRHAHIYAAAGIHPHEADGVTPSVLPALEAIARNPKVRAIGEIGLDYHYDFSPRDVQQRVFREQLALARDLGLPVIVHDREAHEDCLCILRDFPSLRVLFHCYSGSADMARELVRRGYFLGFTGVITFSNAKKAAETVRFLPEDRILAETDAPYMAPVPFRGRRCEPAHVRRVVEEMARIREVSFPEMEALCWQNGVNFFGIEGVP